MQLSFRLKRSLCAVLLFSADVVCPVVANAETANTRQQCAPSYDAPRRIVMEHEGRPGVWIAAPVLNCMVRDLQELELFRSRVSLLGDQLEIRDEQVSDLRRAVELGTESVSQLEQAVERAIAARRRAEERVDVWWRHPALWLSMGVVLTVGLVALTAYALSSVSTVSVTVDPSSLL